MEQTMDTKNTREIERNIMENWDDMLPTRWRIKQKWNLGENKCPLCNAAVESYIHLFTKWLIARPV